MKRFNHWGIALLISVMLLAGLAGNAFALTAACDPVTNLATLSYSVGGVSQVDIGSTETGNTSGPGTATSFFVDAKVDLSMTSPPVVQATGLNNVMRFSITNLGNDTQRYQLQLYTGTGETANGHTDNFDMDETKVRIVIDPDADGTLDSTIDATTGAVTVVGNEILLTSSAAVDGSNLGLTPDVDGDVPSGTGNIVDVYVIADVPAGRSTNDAAHYTLKALTYQVAGATDTTGGTGGLTGNTADDGNTAPSGACVGGQVVLADGDANLSYTPVGDPTDAADAANDGSFFATGTFLVSAAIITVEKDVAYLWDPVNGGTPNARPIPLGYVQYTITISNTGAATANLTTLSDPLASSLALDPDFIDGTAAAGAPPGAAQGGAGTAIKVYTTGSTRSINTQANAIYLTGDNGDSDGDGVGYSGDPGGTLAFNFATLLPVEVGYTTAGELKSGEAVVITFNAIIQ